MPEHVVLGHQVVLADRRILEHAGSPPDVVIASARTGIPPFATTTTRFSNSPRIITYPAGIQRFESRNTASRKYDIASRTGPTIVSGIRERQRREEVHDQREHRANDRQPPAVDAEVLEPPEPAAQR